MAREFDRLKGEIARLDAIENRLPASTSRGLDIAQEVDRAMALLDGIDRVIHDPSARVDIQPLLTRLGLRIGLEFSGQKVKKRVVHRLVRGVMAFGNAPLPVPLHGRNNVEAHKHESPVAAATGDSFTKDGRGDWI